MLRFFLFWDLNGNKVQASSTHPGGEEDGAKMYFYIGENHEIVKKQSHCAAGLVTVATPRSLGLVLGVP